MSSGRLNATHDPTARSWLASANVPGNPFPLQNLPFSEFRRARSAEKFRGGVAIGDQILDLAALAGRGLPGADGIAALHAGALPQLNQLMQLGPEAWSALRRALFATLKDSGTQQSAIRACLVPQAEAEFALPATIGDYTDFYISIYHATAIGPAV